MICFLELEHHSSGKHCSYLLCTAVFPIFSSPHPPTGVKESNNMETQLYKERHKTTQNLECTQITTKTLYHATLQKDAKEANAKANQYFHTNRKQRFMTTAKRPNKPSAQTIKKALQYDCSVSCRK